LDYSGLMEPLYLGVDTGGTKTEVSLIAHVPGSDFSTYRVLGKRRIPTEKRFGIEGFLRELGNITHELLSGHSRKIREVEGIGMGLPGSIHPAFQRMVQGSIPFFKNVDLPRVFRDALGFPGPMIFENDANCFALAEATFGAGAVWARSQKVDLADLCLLGVTLGTGVGGGIVMNGRLIRGRRGGAGEVGHMSLKESDRPCYCGKFGCAEQFLSGPALEHSYQIRSNSPRPEAGRNLFRLAKEGDPYACATLDAYRGDLLRFLSNLSNLLDPHVIVLGGGISLEDGIYTGMEDRLSEGCFLTEDPPAVLRNHLGDAAGAIGAALLAYHLKTTKAGP
jgi:fructokinase